MSTGRKLTHFLLSIFKSVFYYQLKLFSEKKLETARNVAPFKAGKIPPVLSQHKGLQVVSGTDLGQTEGYPYHVLPLMSYSGV